VLINIFRIGVLKKNGNIFKITMNKIKINLMNKKKNIIKKIKIELKNIKKSIMKIIKNK
jgi:hypothetical protein